MWFKTKFLQKCMRFTYQQVFLTSMQQTIAMVMMPCTAPMIVIQNLQLSRLNSRGIVMYGSCIIPFGMMTIS